MSAALADPFDEDVGNRTVTFKPVGPVARAFINDRMFIVDHGALRLGQDDELLPENPQRGAWQRPAARRRAAHPRLPASARPTASSKKRHEGLVQLVPQDEGQLERRAQHPHADADPVKNPDRGIERSAGS
jgi:hypothetical protein